MKHIAHRDFWESYDRLSPELRRIADEKFELLKRDPHHPSLHFKKVGELWSVRVTRGFRALAVGMPQGMAWFWIGPHDEYDRIIRG